MGLFLCWANSIWNELRVICNKNIFRNCFMHVQEFFENLLINAAVSVRWSLAPERFQCPEKKLRQESFHGSMTTEKATTLNQFHFREICSDDLHQNFQLKNWWIDWIFFITSGRLFNSFFHQVIVQKCWMIYKFYVSPSLTPEKTNRSVWLISRLLGIREN